MAGKKSAILSVAIVTDDRQAGKGLKSAEAKYAKFQNKLDSMTLPAAGIVGAATVIGKSFYDLAADAEQAAGAIDIVFKNAAPTMHNFAEQSATALGMAGAEYEALAAGIGGSLSSAGYSQDQLASKTNDLITAGADLSAVFGGDAAEAAGAMGAALRGEFDSLERFGVFLNADAVKAELAARGQGKLAGAAADAAKKQATQALIMQQAGKYAGAFASEADTGAGAQQRATAAWKDASAELGTALIPLVVMGSQALAAFSGFVSENSGLVMGLTAVLVGVAGAILLAQGAIKAYQVIATVATAAQWLWNIALTANPLGLLVVLIIAVAALVVVMYNRFAWFRDGVDSMIGAINSRIEGMIGWIRTAIGWFGSLFGAQSQAQAGGATGFSGYVLPARTVPVDGMPFYMTAAEPGLSMATRSSGPGSGPAAQKVYNYNITVNGALDSNGTAKTIRDMLNRLGRSEGSKAGGFG